MKMSTDEYLIGVAEVVAKKSSCSRRQVGAILTREGRIISTGYNGTPRGLKNCDEGGCPRCADVSNKSGTNLSDCLCSHAEENCISQAAYHGISTKDSTLYTTLFPCKQCAKMLINSGIKEVIYAIDYPSLAEVTSLFHLAHIRVRRFLAKSLS